MDIQKTLDSMRERVEKEHEAEKRFAALVKRLHAEQPEISQPADVAPQSLCWTQVGDGQEEGRNAQMFVYNGKANVFLYRNWIPLEKHTFPLEPTDVKSCVTERIVFNRLARYVKTGE